MLMKKKGRASDAVAGTAAPTALRPDQGGGGGREVHELLLNSQPPGASVYQGDRKLGVTPVRLQFPRSSRKLLLVLRRDGHREGTLAVIPSGGKAEETVRLEPEAAEAPPPLKTRPAGKASKIRRPDLRKGEPKTVEPAAKDPAPPPPPQKKKKTEQSGDLMNPFGD
jgi:hypothetical protein